MVERAFEILFVVSFTVPPVLVLAGALLLAIPRRAHLAVATRTPHTVGA